MAVPEGMTKGTGESIIEMLEGPAEEEIVPDLGAAPTEEAIAEADLIVVDEDCMVLINTETGEVVGMSETPPEDLNEIELAKWIGERRAWHQAQSAGSKAQKQVYLDKLLHFDVTARKHDNAVKWLETTYYKFLEDLAKKLIGDAKKRSMAVGLLMLKLTTTKPSVNVVDDTKAVAYVQEVIGRLQQRIEKLSARLEKTEDPDQREGIMEAISEASQGILALTESIKTAQSILKSKLPEGFKDTIKDEEALEKAGMQYYAGGEIKLKIE